MQMFHSRQSDALTREMLDRKENLSGIMLIKLLLGKFLQSNRWLENAVKLSLIAKDNVMFQIFKNSGQPDSTKRNAHCGD